MIWNSLHEIPTAELKHRRLDAGERTIRDHRDAGNLAITVEIEDRSDTDDVKDDEQYGQSQRADPSTFRGNIVRRYIRGLNRRMYFSFHNQRIQLI